MKINERKFRKNVAYENKEGKEKEIEIESKIKISIAPRENVKNYGIYLSLCKQTRIYISLKKKYYLVYLKSPWESNKD